MTQAEAYHTVSNTRDASSGLIHVSFFYIRPFSDLILREVYSQWRHHSQLLVDSDFALVEPILAVRSVAQHTLLSRVGEPDSSQYLSSVLTDHLMDLCRLARKAGNTQVTSTDPQVKV